MNAREYYYTHIAPQEAGLSYQKVVGIAKATDSDRMKNFVPNLSNDPLIEDMLETIIKRSPDYIQARIKKSFVVKVRDWRSRAFTVSKKIPYDGHLVFFHTGFSIASTIYAKLFLDHISMTEKEELQNVWHELWQLKAQDLIEVEKKWLSSGYDIHLSDLSVPFFDEAMSSMDSTVALSMTMDMAILCHEFSHHFLGHFDGKPIQKDLLKFFPKQCRITASLSKNQKNELDADALAILIQSGILGSRFDDQSLMEAAMGSTLAFTFLGQIIDNPHSSSKSHPAAVFRYEQANSFFKIFSIFKPLKKMLRDFAMFQYSMTNLRGSGIGSNLLRITKIVTENREQAERFLYESVKFDLSGFT